MKAAALILLAALLAACETIPERQPVDIPVRCIASAPARPAYRFDSLPKPRTEAEAASAAVALYRDFESAEQYGSQWEAAAAGCWVLPPPRATATATATSAGQKGQKPQ